MNVVNPFNDPEFKSQLLGKEGNLSSGDEYSTFNEFEDVEEIEVTASNDNLKSIISTAPKIPDKVKNVILDASAIAKNDKDKKAAEISMALNSVFTQYNKEYNTDLQIDFSNLSRTLVNVSNPESRRTMELYLSEIFQSIRPVLILQMIAKLTLAIDYILDPQRLIGGDLTIQDTFVAVEKIMQFIQQLEGMKKDIIISGSNLELKKMADGVSNSDLSPESQQAVNDFMNLFMKDNGIN